MKGILSLMLIASCILTGAAAYAMEKAQKAEIAYLPQVAIATIVKSPSFHEGLNVEAGSEQAAEDAFKSLAKAIDAIKDQQPDEEQSPVEEEQNQMSASVMLNLEVNRSLEATKIETEQAIAKTKSTIELIRKALGQNADTRGELVKQQSELEINTGAALQEIETKLKVLPQILNKDSKPAETYKPITKSIKELAANLVVLDKTKHLIVEKTNSDAALRAQLDELQKSLTPDQQKEVQPAGKKSGHWYTLWF